MIGPAELIRYRTVEIPRSGRFLCLGQDACDHNCGNFPQVRGRLRRVTIKITVVTRLRRPNPPEVIL